jgi:hypothetical protein
MDRMNQETVGLMGGANVLSEATEGICLAQGRLIDELPGAAFAAITLFWVLSTLGVLIWHEVSADTIAHLFATVNALTESHTMNALCRLAGAGSFAKSVYTYFDPS